jgi:membrane protein
MYEKILRYFREDLWNFPLSQERGFRHFFFKALRIFSLAIRGFFRDRCALHASSLTYYTVMASVPTLAIAFAISGAFGYHDDLRARLLQHFPQNRDVLEILFSFVDRMIDQAKGGLIAGVGLLILFWSVIQLLSNLEHAMNEVWKVKRLRTWRRIFSDYFALMLLGPLFFVIASSTAVFLVDKLSIGVHDLNLHVFLSGLLLFIIQLAPYCLFWFLFAFIYLFMPNAKVSFSSAFLGGVIGGSTYVIVQWAYLVFQFGVSRYGAIYGSFAALPLFLIWIQVSWFLLLFGGEITYADQMLEQHEFEEFSKKISPGYKKLLSLLAVHKAVLRFLHEEPPLTRELFSRVYRVPFALTSDIFDELVLASIFIETPNGFLLTRSADQLRVSDVLEALMNRGISDFPFISPEQLAPFRTMLDDFYSHMRTSSQNQLLCHVSNPI